MCGAGTVDVEEKSRVSGRGGHGGERDEFDVPGVRVLAGVGWVKKVCKERVFWGVGLPGRVHGAIPEG